MVSTVGCAWEGDELVEEITLMYAFPVACDVGSVMHKYTVVEQETEIGFCVLIELVSIRFASSTSCC